MSEEKIRKIAEFRTALEERVREAEIELERLRALLEFANTMLLEAGFKRAEIAKPTPPAKPPVQPETFPPTTLVEGERIVPLRTVTGDHLANLHIQKGTMRIVPAEERDFNINTPPFASFLVERVLAKMQERDRESARKGEIPPENILSYDITRDGETIREITIRNITTDRLRELKSAVRWTLEKMYEKTMQPGAE